MGGPLARTPKPSGRPKSAGSTKRPNRDTELTRRANTRDSDDRLMVVCGAETTEYDYITGFKAYFRRRNLSVKIAKKPGSPLQVVEYAAKRWGGAGDDFDQVWCVVDVDEYQDLERAVRCAKRERIELAVSNPCFELWLLLHHTDAPGWVRDYNMLKPLLRKHVDAPDNKAVDFARDYGGRDDDDHSLHRWERAVERARGLAPEGTEHLPESNPATRMWRLTLAINGRAS